MIRRFVITALIGLPSTLSFAQSEQPLPTFSTVDDYTISPGGVHLTGLNQKGEPQTFVGHFYTTSELPRLCDSAIRQVMLKPGKWDLTLITSGTSVSGCRLSLRKAE